MVVVPGVWVSVDERAGTARVEVTLPSREHPLAFTVTKSSDGHGWDVREPLGGASTYVASARGRSGLVGLHWSRRGVVPAGVS